MKQRQTQWKHKFSKADKYAKWQYFKKIQGPSYINNLHLINKINTVIVLTMGQIRDPPPCHLPH